MQVRPALHGALHEVAAEVLPLQDVVLTQHQEARVPPPQAQQFPKAGTVCKNWHWLVAAPSRCAGLHAQSITHAITMSQSHGCHNLTYRMSQSHIWWPFACHDAKSAGFVAGGGTDNCAGWQHVVLVSLQEEVQITVQGGNT